MSAREAWRAEMRSAWLYRRLADLERGGTRADLFRGLAADAERQAGRWREEARRAGDESAAEVAAFRPGPRERLVSALLPLLGPRRMLPALAALKVRGLSIWSALPPGHPAPAEGEVEGRHRGALGGGSLRAAVFGVNDGLVSNASLILGVAGAAGDARALFVAGTAGLVAGGFSMAAGEYLSVRSQRELYERQIALEREELRLYPEEEAEELVLVYRARGLAEGEARALAKRLLADPEVGLAVLAREELGLAPEMLGSPWAAAGSSFAAFAVGAALPLAPILIAGRDGLAAVLFVGAVALFAVGALLSLFTGRGALGSGLRMLLIGGGAGALSWFLGAWIGAWIGTGIGG